MAKQKPFGRSHGILMPMFSLDSPYGIGTLGKPSEEFVDFLCRARANMWQMLPIGPTGYGNSPYQCFSAFAGNPYLLNPWWFFEKGWISKKELSLFEKENTLKVDYGWLYKTRKEALFNAFLGFEKFKSADDKKAFEKFKTENEYWLDDYTSFMALKSHFGMVGREKFKDFSIKSSRAGEYISKNLLGEKEFFAFLEYVFYYQWLELKKYANQKGISLVGDIPLYVSGDSADVWGFPNLFCLDRNGIPKRIAGVPPDMFSKSGQLWGNPIYNWEAHITTNFDWWKKRIKHLFEFFDIIRIDHFIGICRYFEISAGEKTAEKGVWKTGPGELLLKAIQESANKGKFIAEDLGVVTPSVERLLKKSGICGMKLLQFAFDNDQNGNMPHNFEKNSVVYTGTHDNETLVSYFESANKDVRKRARKYLNVKRNVDIPKAIIRAGFAGVENTFIVPFADYLGLDERGRINTPSKTENNWEWRIKGPMDNMLADEIAVLAKIYNREK